MPTKTWACHPAREDDWLASRIEGPMPEGAVLVHSPSFAHQAPGGGEVQMLRTARGLESWGVRVRPFVPWVDRIENARLLHLFGMSPEGLALARVARSRGVPVVLSSICWYDPRSLARLAPTHLRASFDVAKWAARRAVPTLPGWRRELLLLSDAILPNSIAEGRQLVRLFGADPARIRVVPNGVDPEIAAIGPAPFREAFPDLGEFVLYAGRIEPRKGVLGLVRGAKRAGLPLVVVGETVPGHEAYASLCRGEAGPSARWLGRLVPDDPRLASAFSAARVFALPSFFETPGLAALEAALAGSAVVITPFGSTREYFGDLVDYARPDRPREIARSLKTAWNEGRRAGLAETIRRRFLWSHAAEATVEAYDTVAG